MLNKNHVNTIYMKTIIFALCLLTSSLAFSQATEVSAKYDKIGKFENGVAIVQKNGLVGVIDMQGKEVVKVEYDRISNFGKDKIYFNLKSTALKTSAVSVTK